jgi:hypothetical protein
MQSRRTVLAAFVTGTAVGAGTVGVAGDLLTSAPATIEWGNELETEFEVTTTVRPRGTFLSGGDEPVYESSVRLFPTDHYRSVEPNAVPTGSYDVSVVAERPGEGSVIGPAETTWLPRGCDTQRLVVRVEGDETIRFSQREC